MNEVVQFQPQAAAVRQVAMRARDARAAASAAFSTADHLGAGTWLDRLDRAECGWLRNDAKPEARCRWPERRKEAARRAARLLGTLPDADTLDSAKAEIRGIIEADPSNAQNAALIARMLDAFPQRPHAAETYVEELLRHVLAKGFAPGIVAMACDDVVATLRFLPATAEFLSACRDRVQHLRCGQALVESAQRYRGQLEEVIEIARRADESEPPAPLP